MKTLTRILTAALALALWPASTVGQNVEDFAEGARLYGQQCARCHAARSPTERSDAEWTTIVNHMRARANLTKSQAVALMTFLQATNGTEGTATAVAASAPVPAPATSPVSETRILDATGDRLLVLVDLSDPRIPEATRIALRRYLAEISAMDARRNDPGGN